MSVLHFWRKDFVVWLTRKGDARLTRLCHMALFSGSDSRVFDAALALYSKAVNWKSCPVFYLDDNNEYEPYYMTKLIEGPQGRFVWRYFYKCSWREWRLIRQLVEASGDDSLSVTVERALELLEKALEGSLPRLYEINERLDYVPTKIKVEPQLK